MQRKLYSLTSLLSMTVCALLTLTAVAQGQEKKADPSGTWTYTMMAGRDGGTPRQNTLKLKAEGDKLTGSVTSPGRAGGEPRVTEIANGKIKGDEISFTVTREFGGNKFVQKFNGKLAGDIIKGKIESERDGQTQSRDWEAKRAPEKTEKK